MGLCILIIKKGEYGVLLFFDNEVFFVLVLLLVEVFDLIGVGDIFVGGLMGYFVLMDDFFFEGLKCVVVYGLVMVSFCVEKFSIECFKELNDDMIMECMMCFVQLVNFDVKLNI